MFDEMPVEVWADWLEENGEDTAALRAWMAGGNSLGGGWYDDAGSGEWCGDADGRGSDGSGESAWSCGGPGWVGDGVTETGDGAKMGYDSESGHGQGNGGEDHEDATSGNG